MSSRYSICLDKPSIEKRFGINATDDYHPRFNAAPGQLLPVISSGAPNGFSYFYWGQSQAWSKNKTISDKLIHADFHQVKEKPHFLRALESKRCLVPADGFYIWKTVGKRSKIPYRVTLYPQETFCFPGLWEEYEDENDQTVFTFKIILLPANPIVAEIDTHMPAILARENEVQWLDATTSMANLLSILGSSAPGNMTKYTVSPNINRINFDERSLIAPAPAADQFGNYRLFD